MLCDECCDQSGRKHEAPDLCKIRVIARELAELDEGYGKAQELETKNGGDGCNERTHDNRVPHPQRDGAAEIEDDVGHGVESADGGRVAFPATRENAVEDVGEKRRDDEGSECDAVPAGALAENEHGAQHGAG